MRLGSGCSGGTDSICNPAEQARQKQYRASSVRGGAVAVGGHLFWEKASLNGFGQTTAQMVCREEAQSSGAGR